MSVPLTASWQQALGRATQWTEALLSTSFLPAPDSQGTFNNQALNLCVLHPDFSSSLRFKLSEH